MVNICRNLYHVIMKLTKRNVYHRHIFGLFMYSTIECASLSQQVRSNSTMHEPYEEWPGVAAYVIVTGATSIGQILKTMILKKHDAKM